MRAENVLTTETCSKCGRSARGRSYRFYFGRPVDVEIAKGDLLFAKTTSTTTTYQIDGQGSLFLCSRCVRRSKRVSNVVFALLGLLAGVVLLAVGFGKSWWNPALFYVAGGIFFLLLGTGGLIGLFSEDVNLDDGEALAVKLARKRKLGHPDSETYWSASEYAKLRKKQLAGR
jgi:hypothetical protein